VRRKRKDEEVVKLEKETKKLVPPRFHKWIYVFGKKASERMLMRKIQDHTIYVRKVFVPSKGKVYTLKERERKVY